jgi:hypothetical protein
MRLIASGSAIALLLVTVLISRTAAAQDDCDCSGSELSKYSGGNGSPLVWKFIPYMVSPSTGSEPALICYFKRVQNNSTAEVRDVRWEVADFFRQIIPKQQATSACPQIAGI